jgi:hypothetical protein
MEASTHWQPVRVERRRLHFMSEIKVDRAEIAAKVLDDLAVDLDRRGFSVQVFRADGKLRMAVQNRSISHLSDSVYAAPAEDGAWWLWWSWADRLAPIDEIESAAFKIAYVLTPA